MALIGNTKQADKSYPVETRLTEPAAMSCNAIMASSRCNNLHDVFLISTGVDCGTLPDPADGQVNHTAGTTFGQTATYSCNTGYSLVGDGTRTCQATGNWSGSTPTCPGMLLHSVYLWSFHERSENSSETIFGPK